VKVTQASDYDVVGELVGPAPLARRAGRQRVALRVLRGVEQGE
jgi:hypothetical protein